MISVPAAVDRTSLVTLASIVGFLAAGQLLVADPILRYASGLLGFALWMAWFVLVAVRWLHLGR